MQVSKIQIILNALIGLILNNRDIARFSFLML